MLRKFLFIILLALSFSASAKDIQTLTPIETSTQFITPENDNIDNFLGLLIAGLVLGVGFTAFAAFAMQNKEVLEE